jgi:hypothetical protein
MKKHIAVLVLLSVLALAGTQAQEAERAAGLVTEIKDLLRILKKDSTGEKGFSQKAGDSVLSVAGQDTGSQGLVARPALDEAAGLRPQEQQQAVEVQKPVPFLVNVFVDCYLSQNTVSPESRTNRLRAFDVRSGQFDLSMAKISVQRPAEPVGFRLELAFGSAVDIIHTVDGAVDQTYKYIHQAYATAVLPVGKGLTMDVGQFTSPLGAEVIESNLNWHHSRSFLFWYAVPAFHLGLRFTYPVAGGLSMSAFLVNGCSRVVDNNAGKTIGAQVVWVVVEGLTFTQNVLTGPEQAGNNVDRRTVWDAVVAWQAGERLAFNANYDYGSESVSGSMAIWTGLSVMARYAFSDRMALAIRGERFNDRTGLQTGRAQGLSEVTLTGEWRAFPQLLVRAEVRRDWSTEDVFEGATGSETRTSQHTVALSTVFEF